MSSENLKRWELEFRTAAKTDKYAILRDHLRKLDLPNKPKLLMDGTIQLVRACCAYAAIDGRRFSGFIKMQQYDPAKSIDAKYAFTFDLCGKAFARVLISPKYLYGKRYVLDLADLYGHPWDGFNVCGYSSVYITRTDGRNLDAAELIKLEQVVTDDLRFDYSEDELELWFEDSTIEGTLCAKFQDLEI